MKDEELKTVEFKTRKSLKKASLKNQLKKEWKLRVDGKDYKWSDKFERLEVIQNGMPYGVLGVLSKILNISVKEVLEIFDIAQTTYNHKKLNRASLDSRDTELVVVLTEVIDFGQEVFNNEMRKFKNWLSKPVISLNNKTPLSLLDTVTGVHEVKNCLNRLEYGNLA